MAAFADLTYDDVDVRRVMAEHVDRLPGSDLAGRPCDGAQRVQGSSAGHGKGGGGGQEAMSSLRQVLVNNRPGVSYGGSDRYAAIAVVPDHCFGRAGLAFPSLTSVPWEGERPETLPLQCSAGPGPLPN